MVKMISLGQTLWRYPGRERFIDDSDHVVSVNPDVCDYVV